MRRPLVVVFGLTLMILTAAAPAMAASPHFVRTSASGPNNQADLIVSFKEAGLGDSQLVEIEASAYAIATYACRNNGGNFPSDPKKQTIQGPVSKRGQFQSGKNGSVSDSLTINEPPSTLDCPGGQREVLGTVTYSNVKVTDLTNGVSANVPGGPFSRTFVVIP